MTSRERRKNQNTEFERTNPNGPKDDSSHGGESAGNHGASFMSVVAANAPANSQGERGANGTKQTAMGLRRSFLLGD